MSKKEIKLMYETISQSGDLLDMFPGMTGNWKFDKDDFTKYYEINTQLLNNADCFDDGEDDVYTEQFDY